MEEIKSTNGARKDGVQPPTVTQDQIKRGYKLSPFSGAYWLNPYTVVKTGDITHMAEADTMKFVLANTSIPVPQVHNAYVDDQTGEVVIIMDFIEGESLDKVWETYSDSDRASVLSQLREYVSQLRQFKSSFVGSFDGSPCYDQYFYGLKDKFGPYRTEQDFNNGVVKAVKKDRSFTYVDYACEVWRSLAGADEGA